MRKVIHLIPYDGIGGVEIAAKSLGSYEQDGVCFSLRYIYPSVESRAARFNPVYLIKCARELLKAPPEILVLSLWRSAIVGLMVKLVRPRVKLVSFIHNSVDAHWFDFIFTRLAIFCSSEVWADSEASIILRFKNKIKKPVKKISFVAYRIGAISNILPTPVFAFWGRLAPQKDLFHALRFFAEIKKRFPAAKFVIIGPDGGELAGLVAYGKSIGLSDAVSFTGALGIEEIYRIAADASFYLQTSRYEGMAMSVVEAMQMGLVPIVTPVGEIATYCRDGENAIVISEDHGAVADVLALLDDDARYQNMRAQAIATWADQPLYKDSVLAACRKVLGVEISESKA